MNILVIDDTPDVALSILNRLEGLEFEVTFVNKMTAAAKHMLENKYSVVFLGDTLVGGDTITLISSTITTVKSMKAYFFCVGKHVSRATRVHNSLPAGKSVVINPREESQLALAATLIENKFKKPEEKK